MSSVERYLAAVVQYYSLPDRAYVEMGFPEEAYGGVRPAGLLGREKRTVVVGPPGSGKTTLFDWTASWAASERSAVPVFISLRNYGSTLADLTRLSVERFIPKGETLELSVDGLGGLQPIFLLDGLDEVPIAFRDGLEREIKQLSRTWSDASLAVSSRPPALTSDVWRDWTVLEMPSWSDAEVRDFLADVPRSDELLNELLGDLELRRLSRRPLFLATIRDAWIQGDSFRETLMRELPRYTAWRGHTKSLLPPAISPSQVDAMLELLALDLARQGYTSVPIARLPDLAAKLVDDQALNGQLCTAVLGTDVVTQLDAEAVGFKQLSYLESYAARAIISKLRAEELQPHDLEAVLTGTVGEGVARSLFGALEDEELERLFDRGHAVARLYELSQALLPELHGDGVRPRRPQGLATAVTDAVNFGRHQEETRRDILVISLHGINTRGDWQNELGFQLGQATDGERYLHMPWDYGLLRAGILSPLARRRILKKFQVFFNTTLRGFQTVPEICIVAHSFGTYLAGQALLRFPEIRCDRLLMLGSALPRDFDWAGTSGRCGRVLNVVGGSDLPLQVARCVPGLGDAGRRGFADKTSEIHELWHPYSLHSDFFGSTNMRDMWLPFLRNGDIPPQDATPANP